MKKMFLMAAMVALTLASCNADKDLDSMNNKAVDGIEFRTLTDKATKAAITNGDNMLSFTVTGMKMKESTPGEFDEFDGGYLFNAFGITRGENNSWDYTPKRYWPEDRKVDFYAYSPSSSIHVSPGITDYDPNGSNNTITYTVPPVSETDAQEDFLIAKLTGQDEEKGAVKLNFHHALSRIMFYAKTTQRNITYTIEEVELLNLNTKGKLNLSNGAIQESGSLIYGSDKVVLWEEHEDMKDFTVDMGNSPIYLLNDYASILGKAGAMLVMPQTTTLSSKGTGKLEPEYGEFAIKVAYKAFIDDIYYAGSATEPAVKYFAVKDPKVASKGITFEMGRQYNFFLGFGEDVGGVISFEVSVSDWDNDVPGIYIPEINDYTNLVSADLGAIADENHDGTITYDELQAVTDLVITETSFDFTGLEHFTQLKSMSISGVTNGPNLDASKNLLLTTVTIGNSTLGTVNLSNGILKNLTFSGNNTIGTLNASKNRLTNNGVVLNEGTINGNLNLSGNTSLTEISLTGANITGTLNLSNCGLTSVNMTSGAITTLNLSNNMFATASFRGVTFTNLSVSNNELLETLNITEIEITGKLDATENAALKYIENGTEQGSSRTTIKELNISDSRALSKMNVRLNHTITTLIVWDGCTMAYLQGNPTILSIHTGDSKDGYVYNIKTASGTVLKQTNP